MDESLTQRIKALIFSDASLLSVVEGIREIKKDGYEQEAVRSVLEGLRKECRTEAEEDRILEVLDFVTGFCAPDWRIWDD